MNRPDPPGELHRSDHLLVVQASEADASAGDYHEVAIDDDTNTEQSVTQHDLEDYHEGENHEGGYNGYDGIEEQQRPQSEISDVPNTSKLNKDTSRTGMYERHEYDPILDFEPSHSKTEAISFHVLCTRLEKMWQQRHLKKNRQSKEQVFSLLIDDNIRQYLRDSSWFPLLRLVLPDLDTSRPHTGMKERNIAIAWGEAFDLTPGTRPFERLLQFQDPAYFANSSRMYAVSDLSMAVQEIVEQRDGTQGSQINLKQMNDFLDALVALKGAQSRRSNHDWRENSTGDSSKKAVGPLLKHKRRDWVRSLRAQKLSALEHKWVVRILLQKMEFGFSSKTVLTRWIPGGVAIELYRMNNSLKRVCTTLSNPHWLRQRNEMEQKRQDGNGHDEKKNARKVTWMERPKGVAVLGNTIAPMLALKVFFRDALAELCRDHRANARRMGINLLQVKNPAILCEVKLDGERMVVHVRRGNVTMHTRRGRWYSDIYSVVLAPSIRRSLAKWDVDVILDGEVIAWDDGKQETIPFGNNRTVALARERWMESQGLVQEQDKHLHKGQSDMNVMKRSFVDVGTVESVAGSECWLRYEVFDILHVSGPQAFELLSEAKAVPCEQDNTGSIINLNGFQRKRVLHRLIVPQEKEIVLVPAMVVRPNGDAVPAEEYFSATNPTLVNGYEASIVDSIEWGLEASEMDREAFDDLKGFFSDGELGLRRAESVDRFYYDIVDLRGLEGILLKDLNAFYLLEGRKYWCKHKPDYEENSKLGDIDLLVLGAYHGTGMGPSGKLNGFLCGCVDDENPETFIPVVKVNAGSVSRDISDEILASTGYKKQTDTVTWDTGQWFRGDSHERMIPEFISRRSLEHTQRRPPLFDKKKYPDLWIHPEDSFILTLKAGEVVATDGFHAGVTLRFPRIERVRMKDSADDKDARHVETLDGLLRTYREQMQRREGSGEVIFKSAYLESGRTNRMFASAEEGLRKKSARRSVKNYSPTWIMPIAERKESSALEGLSIVALEGIYHLDEGSLDAEEAKEQGWFDIAKMIKSRDDVLLFISKHGGTAKISTSQDTDFVVGGRADDSRVVMHQKGLERAKKERGRRRTGLTSEEMIRIGNALKWTYLIAMVHLWKNEVRLIKVEPGEEMSSFLGSLCIKSTHPHLLVPPRHQYLVAAPLGKRDTDSVFGISIQETCTMIDLKRGLEDVANETAHGSAKQSKQMLELSDIIPWQFSTHSIANPEIRRCLKGPYSKLWHCTDDTSSIKIIVIYPDLFHANLGERDKKVDLDQVKTGQVSERWDQVSSRFGPISSCLPLAQCMGAQVTPHLHDGVTHVLCLLSKEIVRWKDFDLSCFVDIHTAEAMRIRLWDLHRDQCPVVFVSPQWIRSQWNQQDELSIFQ